MPRRTAATWARYALFLLKEFRWPLLVLAVLILGGGAVVAHAGNFHYGKACYGVFMLVLANPTLEFPDRWYAQVLFFATPLVGLCAIADSLVRLGYLIFTSKRKLQEWWIMEASTLRNHVVVCGLGRVGYRVARQLRALGESVVAIERNRECCFAEEMLAEGIPVIFGETRLRATLEKANLAAARAVILATDDDLANLDAALTAREIRPDIAVAMRLFDDTLADKVGTAFRMPVISTSQVSAPAFVAAATGRAVLHSFQLDGQTIHVADLRVDRLAPRVVPQVEKEFEVSVVLQKTARSADLAPDRQRPLEKGDRIVVAAPIEKIRRLEAENRG